MPHITVKCSDEGFLLQVPGSNLCFESVEKGFDSDSTTHRSVPEPQELNYQNQREKINQPCFYLTT